MFAGFTALSARGLNVATRIARRAHRTIREGFADTVSGGALAWRRSWRPGRTGVAHRKSADYAS
ncbi:hypothetical protein BRPE64_CCDS07190 [Caballeronia insecticola]|uniref:Uncharacterized protein n=1 Tax=Caballeronia insecticola TaxID=758793 RepID=R4X3X5_9BURK|nr:hypothetical protein BRPE64_CCDS07190 [Caballeronia insecticola]